MSFDIAFSLTVPTLFCSSGHEEFKVSMWLFLPSVLNLVFVKIQINFCWRLCMFIYIKLVWEPSAAQVTKSFSLRLPALERFYRETKFPLFKSTHSTFKTKVRTFPWISRVSQSKFEVNRTSGIWVMIWQTNRQTPKQRVLYIHRCCNICLSVCLCVRS